MFTQKKPDMSKSRRMLWPVGAGLVGALLLTGLYFGLVSWAESIDHALDLFWEERGIVIPMILGFGVQMALYTILWIGLILLCPLSHLLMMKYMPHEHEQAQFTQEKILEK